MQAENALHGWLVIDKPKGITSFDVIRNIKRILPKKTKIGHTGTLDPMATGVLPVAIGEATKTIQFIQNEDKAYIGEITFGSSTNTDDAEGEVIEKTSNLPLKDEVTALLSQFTGNIRQVPPIFSAVHVDGKRAYKLARNNEEVKLEPRDVTVHELDVKSMELDGNRVEQLEAYIACSKGTYIRSIARDLGKQASSLAHLSALRRVQAGCFSEKDAISLEKLEKCAISGELFGCVRPIGTALTDILAIPITAEIAAKLRYGQTPEIDHQDCDLIQVIHDDKLVAVASVKDHTLKPLRVFNI